jgi:hypothetical protein
MTKNLIKWMPIIAVIVGVTLTTAMSLLAWIALSIVGLKEDIAEIKAWKADRIRDGISIYQSTDSTKKKQIEYYIPTLYADIPKNEVEHFEEENKRTA